MATMIMFDTTANDSEDEDEDKYKHQHNTKTKTKNPQRSIIAQATQTHQTKLHLECVLWPQSSRVVLMTESVAIHCQAPLCNM